MLLNVATAMLAVAAIVGITLAIGNFTGDFRGRKVPAIIGGLHGVTAATGLTILAVATFTEPVGMLVKVALGLFAATLAGGLLLLSLRIAKKPIPKVVVTAHATLAVAAFAVLLVGIYG